MARVARDHYSNVSRQHLESQMRMRSVMLATAMFASALGAGPSLAQAESVYVKYRGEVDLKSFDCTEIARSSFIKRVCCQLALDRDPVSASKGDPLVLRFERLAFAPSELVGVAETGRARVDV
jgi:hypothetical protein